MELLASHIAKLPGVETREYRPGDLLHSAERLRQLHIYVRKGAVALHVAAGRATDAILEVFGPGWLLSPPLWESTLTPETRHAAALLSTTTLELGADAFGRHLDHFLVGVDGHAAYSAASPLRSGRGSGKNTSSLAAETVSKLTL